MKLVINHNNETTVVAMHNYRANCETKSIEFLPEYDALRIHNHDERLTIRNKLFSLVTPFQYNFLVIRKQKLNAQYEHENALLKSSEWLLYGNTYFTIDNANVYFEDFAHDLVITIEVPDNATVSLETSHNVEELSFKEFCQIEHEEVVSVK